jgi:sugar lactone lactonase YvrE
MIRISLVIWGGFLGTTAASAQATPVWRFVEDLRIGSENDDPTGFSDIRGLLVDRASNIWVLEFSTQEIRVFDPSGHHLRNIGRKGQGPGEFIYPDGMALAPDGLVWVHDPQNGRFSVFSQDGKFVRQQLAISNGYGFIWFGGIDAKGRIWDQLIGQTQEGRMRRASGDWQQVDTVALPPCHQPGGTPEEGVFKLPRGGMGVPFFPRPVATIDFDNSGFWCVPSGAEYRVLKIGIEKRDTLARISGKAERVAVTTAERDSAINRVKEFMKRAGEASIDWSRIPRYKPIVLGGFVDADGRLWLQRQGPEPGALFDVFTAQGKSVATVKVPFTVSTFKKPVVHGNVAYFISQEAGEVPYVVRGHLVATP